MAATAHSAPPTDTLEADAFRRLYPAEYYAKFIAQSVRPDGRPLGVARSTSVGLGAVSTADASALVKVGASTALAGIKCEVMAATDDAPDEGRVVVAVELAPLCSASTRPGRPSESAQVPVGWAAGCKHLVLCCAGACAGRALLSTMLPGRQLSAVHPPL